jgi:hypothetical protein
MNKKNCVTKSVLVMLVIAVVFAGTTGCAKSSGYYFKQIDNYIDKGYPKAERIPGKLVSDIKHEVVDGTAIIEDRAKHSSDRWWVDVRCDYWASCFMRCDGPKQQCRKLAEDSNFTVNSISPF